jgi:two-component system CheB/CheR fusion protein
VKKRVTKAKRPRKASEVLSATAPDITERKPAEDELRESEIRYKTLFDNVGDGIFIRDLQGHFLEVNRVICERLGYSRDELLHMTVKDIDTLENASLNAKRTEEIQQQGHLIFETAQVSRDGRVIPTEISARIIQYKNQPTILSIARDITERKRLGDAVDVARQYAENIVSTVRDPMVVLDSDLKIVSASRSFYENFKVNPKETEGKSLYEIGNRQWDNPELRRLLTEILPAKSIITDFELTHVFPTIGQKVMLLNARKVQAELGREPFILLAIEDITERKRMEKMRIQFISAVTHELRTPLVPIKANVDFVLSGRLGPLPEKVEVSLQVVKRNIDRLALLTDELLDIRRLESGRFQLNFEPLDFRDVINQSIKEMQAAVDLKKQSLRVEIPDEPLPIHGDSARLGQVLLNLLANASKFTPENGLITVKVEEEADAVKVQVSDTGLGLRTEDLVRVFEPFSAIEKPVYIKGTGLGLSLAKGLVEAHGGEIWAESAGEGKGATFTFTIPKNKKGKD